MKRHFTALLLVLTCILFILFILHINSYKKVLEIYSPTKFGIDLNRNKIIDSDEIICVENLETFSLNPTENFVEKYSKNLNISAKELMGLGYLAEEFTQKKVENKNVKIKYTNHVTTECKYANITIEDYDYRKTLLNSGFGLSGNKTGNPEKFKQNLENAKKLNLVILNHRSGKFHTLDCPYGKIAHDAVIIPHKHLPKNAIPCKFCHKQDSKITQNNNKNLIYNIPQIPQPPLSFSTTEIDLYYTDFSKQLSPNKNCGAKPCKVFVNLINNAKNSIDIAAYGYNEIPEITNALRKAKDRGVNIRYVYDESFETSRKYYTDNQIIKDLATKSTSDKIIGSKVPTNYLMHNKFGIFDNKIVFTGSMNFSPAGTSGYDVNSIVVLKSSEIANLYTKEFEQMLEGKFHLAKSKLTENNTFTLKNSTVEIFFSPKDKSTVRICELIREAKSYIYLPTFLITHKNITHELINAKKRGVDVRVILDANGTSTRNSKHNELRKNDILLKTENYAGKLHAKSIIIDDTYIVTGSMNFSNSGENKNDENVVIIKNSGLAKMSKNFFLYLWTLVPNKYLTTNAKPEGKQSIGSCTDGVDNNFNGKIDKEESYCK